ncbi:TauD/TfdA family dioxygenase [Tsukamurella sp. 8F]|uniref:TauD/TfdA dioxygenase family protein n=1 Tax=unclassified Tsukamurella TaxID=2633480 RepID=UPI0023B98610|nr:MULTISPECIES: TauD/TfdA family dioxygenase [unclassified Tsukamurella]MDF0529712.1 TauD/TfdA family dioxygenase [Tsukamurella sp. 8J]MDF0585997.1 TauD/TfdA family dioxygenase [Tsukamurella sp. 8F]
MSPVLPQPDVLIQPDTGPLTVTKLGEHIGAVVEGIRLSGDLDRASADHLLDLLAEHEVLIVRGQQHLTDEEQYAFARRLGTPTTPHPTVRPGSDLLPIEGAANSWHTDVSFVDRVPKVSILRAVTLPPYGGATQWASTTRAYDRLPAPLKALADNLRAVHTNDYDYAEHNASYQRAEYHKEFIREIFQTEHPVVRVHPETGRRSLLLGHFVKQFAGLSLADSAALHAVLQRRIENADNTVRWSWTPGDIAIWDNRSTQHFGVNDYGDHTRLLRRVTLAGDVPVGVRGDVSRVLRGDASDYSPIVTARADTTA